MPAPMLVDSSFLYALYDESEPRHLKAFDFALNSRRVISLVPDVVLTEVAFLFRRSRGIPGVLGFLDSLAETHIQFEHLLKADIRRAREIMATYADARLDFVDCCILALAERLDVTQVCTFDRRDFEIVRPKHCDRLELLP